MLRARDDYVELRGYGSGTRPGTGSLHWPFIIQAVTFVLSILAQIAGLVIGFIGLTQENKPAALHFVLVLEIVVQCIELVWYSGVGVVFLTSPKTNLGVATRYIDWLFTTPVMLLSIFTFVLWENEQCSTVPEIFAKAWRTPAIVIMLLMDWVMLWIGFSYEARDDFILDNVCGMVCRGFTPRRWTRNALDSLWCGMQNYGLLTGFVPFLGIFIPFYTLRPRGLPTYGGTIIVVITTILWLIYGIASVSTVTFGWLGATETDRDISKNIIYNLLDIFAKNAVGIIVGITAISQNNTNNVTDCLNGTFFI